MTAWRSNYWRLYNVLVRGLGMLALVAGAGFVFWGLLRLMQMGLQLTEGTPWLVLMLVGLISVGFGAAMLGVPTYRPDLGDPAWDFDPLGRKARQATIRRQSWWTGER